MVTVGQIKEVIKAASQQLITLLLADLLLTSTGDDVMKNQLQQHAKPPAIRGKS